MFDEFKNKLGEKKSWASSATAKTNQARLICLTHNLMTLLEEDDEYLDRDLKANVHQTKAPRDFNQLKANLKSFMSMLQ